MTPDQLAEAVLDAARVALTERGLESAQLPAAASVERPRNPEHGDYSTNLALQVAKRVGLPPRELAQAVADQLARHDSVAKTEVAGPGFINITVDPAAAGRLAGAIVGAGGRYGHGTALAGLRINLEFVSVNPTGPIHIGGVRWAAVGDALARLLKSQGADVGTEYYFNDAGSQIDRFAKSLLATARSQPVPEDGYHGEYIAEIADAVVQKHPEAPGLPDDEAQELFRVVGVGLMFDEVKTKLAEFGVHFDRYFNEKELHDRGELATALEKLRAQGRVYEKDGATWIRTTDFDDDKDRVYVRSTGAYTYYAADCAYYLDKRERGFDKVVIMLGADHHGYIGRLRAMAASFGDNPDETLEILIGQLVNLVRDGQPVRMSKRAGTVVSLDDLVDAVGVDAARYALARYSVDSPIDVDLDLWTRRTNDNPIYYVQYVAARTAGVSRNATEVGLVRGDGYDPALLTEPKELDLLKSLGDFPATVATAAELREPHRVARYLEELAGT